MKRAGLSSLGGLVAVALAWTMPWGAVAHAGQTIKVAVFPFGLIDDSQEGATYGQRSDEVERLALSTAALLDHIRADGRYMVMDLSPIAAELRDKLPIHSCNHCEDALARAVGAELAIVATVQKVSNLILNLNLYVRDVSAERITRAMSTDIRGNTDESWLGGVRFLARNRLLVSDEALK